MTSLSALLKDEVATLSLEPEELALPLLQYLVEQEDGGYSGTLNPHNLALRFTSNSKPVLDALMEAWGWLQTSGSLAPKAGQSSGWYFVTRRGRQIAKDADTAALGRAHLLPQHLIHSAIKRKVYSAFLRGEYDSAVFESFKQVEIAVRVAGQFPDTMIGVKLVREAFKPEGGSLTDESVPLAEREALSALFAGAIGSYKNPHSHRNVVISDPTEAAEMIILATHLINIVDARSKTQTEAHSA